MISAWVLAAAIALGNAPQVGDVAPDFNVKDTDGKVLNLGEMLKEGPVILAFFPKAFTPGCTRELTAYRDRNVEMAKSKGRLVAVSMDDAATMKKFKESLSADYSFVSDPKGKLTSAYEVKTGPLPFPQRYTFVIGQDGKILQVQSGADAIDPSAAIKACQLGRKDGGG
jgi:peroxiredoxin